jgi:hypothetical protein
MPEPTSRIIQVVWTPSPSPSADRHNTRASADASPGADFLDDRVTDIDFVRVKPHVVAGGTQLVGEPAGRGRVDPPVAHEDLCHATPLPVVLSSSPCRHRNRPPTDILAHPEAAGDEGVCRADIPAHAMIHFGAVKHHSRPASKCPWR